MILGGSHMTDLWSYWTCWLEWSQWTVLKWSPSSPGPSQWDLTRDVHGDEINVAHWYINNTDHKPFISNERANPVSTWQPLHFILRHCLHLSLILSQYWRNISKINFAIWCTFSYTCALMYAGVQGIFESDWDIGRLDVLTSCQLPCLFNAFEMLDSGSWSS